MVKVTTTKNVNPGARAFGFCLLAAVLLLLTIWRTIAFTETHSWLTVLGAFGLSALFMSCIVKVVGYTLAMLAEKIAAEMDKVR